MHGEPQGILRTACDGGTSSVPCTILQNVVNSKQVLALLTVCRLPLVELVLRDLDTALLIIDEWKSYTVVICDAGWRSRLICASTSRL